ncbi:GLEYA domain-containing protein [Xylaria flabelliformis]|nr:GLEYA domain-containing protein [Xylaria flabelliformis]
MIHSLSLLFLATGALSSILPLFPSPGTSPDNYPTYPTYPTDDCPSCSKPKHCSNEGWDWAYYPNPLTNNGENYPGFKADVFKTKTPTYTGVTPFIGGLSALGASDGKIYNSTSTLNSTYFVLNQHAYLWACEKGTWQFDISGVDDLVLAWVGDVAYSGWTDANANARAVWTFQGTGSHTGSASFTTDLEGGSFVPVRFVFANAQGGGAFKVTITSPSGIIVHQTGRTANNDWVVRRSCDESTAPEFPSFGKES